MASDYCGARVGLIAVACLNLLSITALAAETPESIESEPEEDRIVVTGSRIPVAADQLGTAITLIDTEDIEARGTPLVSDLLRMAPSAAVSRTGPMGGFTQVRLRGAEANQTLVLIDGVEVSDPISGEFDFGDLLTTDVERVEVARGEHSSLWGSEAIGGVIHIITRRGEGPPALSGKADYGSFDTWRFSGSASTGSELYSAFLSGTLLQSGGTNIARGFSERDGYANGTVFFNGGLRPRPGLGFDVGARYVNSRNDEDAGFPAPMDTDTEGTREQISARGKAHLDVLGGRWRHAVSASVNDVAARGFDDSALTAESAGRRLRLDYQGDLSFRVAAIPDTEHRITVYAERESNRFTNASPAFGIAPVEARSVDWAVATEYSLTLGRWGGVMASVRYDGNERFRNTLTYRTAVSAVIPGTGTRLHGSVGTGVQNPGFFDLFGFDPGFFLGNPDLLPERSFGWDAGVQQRLGQGIAVFDVTYFNARLRDEIVQMFVPPSPDLPGFPGGALTPVNADLAGKRRGVEVSVSARPLDALSLRAAYTYTDATEQGAEEVRRPNHMASLTADFAFMGDRTRLGLAADYVGPFDDFDFSTFPASRVRLGDFMLLGLHARYRVAPGVNVFLRGENLLNQRYEEVLFFRAPGVSVTGGVALRLESTG